MGPVGVEVQYALSSECVENESGSSDDELV
jgi:hypothetical protein